MGLKRTYSKIDINHKKLKEFSYCTLTFVGDIHDLLADALIKNDKLLSYLEKSDNVSLDFLRKDLIFKLKKLKNAAKTKTNFKINDGIYMNFLAYEALKEFYDIKPLYLLQRSDVENPKFGLDSIFYSGKNVWVFEFKSSVSSLNEKAIAKKIYNGVESLFCTDFMNTASLFDCQTSVTNKNLDPRLNDVLQRFIDNSEFPEKLINDDDLIFNVCIVTPAKIFSESQMIEHIKNEYLSCEHCSHPCNRYKCPRYENVKILNVFHLQLPDKFSLETLYNKLILRMGG